MFLVDDAPCLFQPVSQVGISGARQRAEKNGRRQVAGGWLGEPLEIRHSEADPVERVRRAAFGGSAAMPLQHLGEAQTLHVIRSWPDFASSFWLSDDRAACDFARRQGITTLETQDVMAYGCSAGDVTHTDAYKLLGEMRDAGRHLALPSDASGLLQ
ncbi:hypothetical protein ACGFMO_25650 [Streptomyces niveus]|uniref:Uncharacterized protein n=1 Tax=Streptomyces niveus TaxID=193462 RepID=A0ABZ1ZUC9_STRNV|nr:hypothetical protein [Streptomyces niveus]